MTTTPKKYRKKPAVIEAIQLGIFNTEAVEEFVGGDLGTHSDGGLVIATLEGAMRASIGDYIIKGVQGEFYPCKPDIFAETYEEV
ncbi:MazG-like nucleotide pyrophosphohydrolase [Gordonia phage DatBoi]|nr:MazG-like nucleotide pyrophosphohydrolase [Gordonia phage DatBoi]